MKLDRPTEISFGEWLKRQRKAAGWTQAQLADQVGCSAIAVRKIEAEERRPSEQIVERLADIFRVPPAERREFLLFARGRFGAGPRDANPAPWTDSARSHLPAAVTSLIGREQQIVEVRGNLQRAEVRLVTLIGPPGIGKTRLGVEVASRASDDFPDGVFFIELAPLDDPTLIAPVLVQTLGFVETGDDPPERLLADGIGGKSMLLVLDNCEHLIERAALLVSALLPACPRLKILATSREALRVPGEWQIPVPTLGLPDQNVDLTSASDFPALTLFAERARAARLDFKLSADNLPSVAAICAQLDGLPLAIELIAARIRFMSPQALLERMTSQFVLSADGMRAVSMRQKTLGNAIGWSYELLPEKEKTLFHRLSIFVKGWSLESAQEVCAGENLSANEIPDLLMSLAFKSLISVDDLSISPRYQMLEPIRQYAFQKLTVTGDMERMKNRHLDFFVGLAEEAEKNLHESEQLNWMRRLNMEQGNLRSALKWGLGNRSEAGYRLVSALWLFWFMQSQFIESSQWFREALAGNKDIPQKIQIRLLIGMASNAMGRNDFEETRKISERSLALSQGQEDEWGIAMSLHHLGIAACMQGKMEHAWETFQEGLTLSRNMHDLSLTGYMLGDLGTLAEMQGNYDLAGTYFNEALAITRSHGDDWTGAYILFYLANLAYKKDSFEQAKTYVKDALLLSSLFDDKRLMVDQLVLLGMIDVRLGMLERAAVLMEIAKKIMDSIGLPLKQNEFVIKTLKDQLGEGNYRSLQFKKIAMSAVDIVSYALKS